jgi:hypothetical protein
MDGFRVKVEGSGRRLLPVKVRKQLKRDVNSRTEYVMDSSALIALLGLERVHERHDNFSRAWS